jgi:hypothetical protein
VRILRFKVSPPVCAMAITFFLSNAGVLPPGGSTHVTELQVRLSMSDKPPYSFEFYVLTGGV